MSSGLTDWLIDGTSLRWDNLAKLVGGSFIVTGSVGFVRIQQGIVAAFTYLLGGVAGFYSEAIETLLGWPAQVGIAAWNAATAFVTSFGVPGAVLAVTIGLVTLYVYQEAIQ